MPEETARLDFTKPPPGYTVDGQWWSFPAPPRAPHPRDIGSPQAFSIAMVAPNSGGLVAAWAHYKAHTRRPSLRAVASGTPVDAQAVSEALARYARQDEHFACSKPADVARQRQRMLEACNSFAQDYGLLFTP